MLTPEGVTKKDIVELLDSYANLYYMMPVQSGYGERLIDVYICFKGLFIAVEAKRRGGRARKFQQRILDRVRDANGEALCIDDVAQLKELLDFIARHDVKLVEKRAEPLLLNPVMRSGGGW
jgi:hypothetical protein